nr:MAG: hypothetical protein [Microvirus sp.]
MIGHMITKIYPHLKNAPYYLTMEIYHQLQELSMKRKHLSKHKSHKNFKRGLSTNKKNISPAPTRGGYRL